MLIIFDKLTGRRITDFGKNQLFPEGIDYEQQQNEIVYRIHDNDPWVEQYLAGDIANVTATIANGVVTAIQIPTYVPPTPLPPQPTELELANKRIETLEQQLSDTNTNLQGFMDLYFSVNP